MSGILVNDEGGEPTEADETKPVKLYGWGDRRADTGLPEKTETTLPAKDDGDGMKPGKKRDLPEARLLNGNKGDGLPDDTEPVTIDRMPLPFREDDHVKRCLKEKHPLPPYLKADGSCCGCWCHRLVSPKPYCTKQFCGKARCRFPVICCERRLMFSPRPEGRVEHADGTPVINEYELRISKLDNWQQWPLADPGPDWAPPAAAGEQEAPRAPRRRKPRRKTEAQEDEEAAEKARKAAAARENVDFWQPMEKRAKPPPKKRPPRKKRGGDSDVSTSSSEEYDPDLPFFPPAPAPDSQESPRQLPPLNARKPPEDDDEAVE